jgi:hypothetical protein
LVDQSKSLLYLENSEKNCESDEILSGLALGEKISVKVEMRMKVDATASAGCALHHDSEVAPTKLRSGSLSNVNEEAPRRRRSHKEGKHCFCIFAFLR